jgi:hypothetical protein
VEAPLVFIGYGLNASEEGYDDFAGVDSITRFSSLALLTLPAMP